MKKLSNEELLAEMEVPFPVGQVLWRVTNTANKRTRGQVVPYADPRAYTDRLNALVSPQGGRNDALFLPAAPEFVKQIVPTADLRYFDGGHFVLDEYADAIAEAIIETFSPIHGNAQLVSQEKNHQ
jgi:hypothetical protein